MHHIDVRVEKDIYDVNNTLADNNAKNLKDHGVRAFDLLGAIGSGKLHSLSALSPAKEEGTSCRCYYRDAWGR
jgi:hydrogenase nickel incorporation protein HypB